jgi:hypothetical protein
MKTEVMSCEYRDTDVVLFTDGFDVVWTRGPDHILKSFVQWKQEFGTPPISSDSVFTLSLCVLCCCLVLSAEFGCWPWKGPGYTSLFALTWQHCVLTALCVVCADLTMSVKRCDKFMPENPYGYPYRYALLILLCRVSVPYPAVCCCVCRFVNTGSWMAYRPRLLALLDFLTKGKREDEVRHLQTARLRVPSHSATRVLGCAVSRYSLLCSAVVRVDRTFE